MSVFATHIHTYVSLSHDGDLTLQGTWQTDIGGARNREEHMAGHMGNETL